MTSRKMQLTRVDVADVARRARAMSEGTSEPTESSLDWVRDYRQLRDALGQQVADVELLNRFAAMADGDERDDDRGIDIEWQLARVDGDANRLARDHRQALGRVAGALDFMANSPCSFAEMPLPRETMPAFVDVALAVAEGRSVKLDKLIKLEPQFSGPEWSRHGCAMVDVGLAQAIYGNHMYIEPSHCSYWLAKQAPKSTGGDIVHGDKIEIRTGVNVARGASAQGITVQDNSHGGTGSVDASQADVAAFFNQLVSTVKARADAPDEDLRVAIDAKALAKAGDTSGAVAMLRRGTGWLGGIVKEVVTKVGVEAALQHFGLK